MLMRLFARGRERETDSSNRPILRYLAAPYLMFGCACLFLGIGIYQWFDPFNHRHPGNLFWLSYLPASIGLFATGAALYYLTYRATLTRSTIVLYRWPLGHKTYALKDLERIETGEPNTVLHFTGNRRFTIYYTYSGRAHFLSALSANNSFKPTPLCGAA